MYLIVIEPGAALHRHAHTARRRYELLVVTQDVTNCLAREQVARRAAGLPDGTDIDRIVECDTRDAAAIREAIENFRGEVAGVVAGDEAVPSVAIQLEESLGCA